MSELIQPLGSLQLTEPLFEHEDLDEHIVTDEDLDEPSSPGWLCAGCNYLHSSRCVSGSCVNNHELCLDCYDISCQKGSWYHRDVKPTKLVKARKCIVCIKLAIQQQTNNSTIK